MEQVHGLRMLCFNSTLLYLYMMNDFMTALFQGTFAGIIIGLTQLNCSELKLRRLCYRQGYVYLIIVYYLIVGVVEKITFRHHSELPMPIKCVILREQITFPRKLILVCISDY